MNITSSRILEKSNTLTQARMKKSIDKEIERNERSFEITREIRILAEK
jgi:hypothetical protein